MAEQAAANPQPEAAPELSIEERLNRLYSPPRKPAEPEQQAEAPQDDAPDVPADAQPAQDEGQSEEVSPDDIPDDENAKPGSADEFEIVHNGTQVKLDRAKAIELAQKGFDYERKTAAVAEKSRAVEARLQQAEELAQLVPAISKELAQVEALQQQLSQWQNVDWVQLATNDPLEYPKYRAQFDTLKNAFDHAKSALDESGQKFMKQKAALARQRMQEELPRLQELIPQWKDPEKFRQGSAELRAYLVKQGVPEERVDAMNSALEVSLAWKAKEYDRLVAAKADKVKQMRQAPPVVKPGALGTTQTAAQKQVQQVRQNLKKSGDWRDAAYLLGKMK